MKTFVSLNLVLVTSLLVAGCAPATLQEDKNPVIEAVELEQVTTPVPGPQALDLSQALPERIASGWEVLFETSIDPQGLEEIEPPPTPVVGGYVRVWQADDRLLWAAVFQFADTEGAAQAYDVIKAGLRNDVQPEDLGDESVSSTSALGLKIYVLHRGSYLFNAGSAIMDDPETPPPDVALLRQLAEDSDTRMQRSGQGALVPGLVSLRPSDTLTRLASSQTGFGNSVPVEPVAFVRKSLLYWRQAPSANLAATTTDVLIPLVSRKLGKQNGTITITVKTTLQGKTDNRCKYRAEVYVKKIEIGEDDGDDWIRGDGDIFAGGEVSTVCSTVGFVSPLLANLGPGESQDLTGGGKSSGVFVGSRECEVDCRETFTYSAVVVVRDSDDDDALDKATCILNIVSAVLGGKPEGETAREVSKGIEKVRQKKHTAKTDPSSRITDAENVLGDEIGGGDKSGEGPLPVQSVSTAAPVNVIGVWTADEQQAFEAAAESFTLANGIQVEFVNLGQTELPGALTAMVETGDPPDVALLPSPVLLSWWLERGALATVDHFMDLDELKADYGDPWLDLGSYGGSLYAIFYKVGLRSLVWYSPKAFEVMGYAVPTTWDELIALSDRIVADGGVPWCLGVESGSASGWPAADWIKEILLRTAGSKVYDQWANHQIPWTDPAVRNAWELFGQIARNEQYVYGGTAGVLNTNFADSPKPLFDDPPGCYMHRQGSFAPDFFGDGLIAMVDYDFFPLPPIDPAYGTPMVGWASPVVMFSDTPEARAFMQYLASPEAQAFIAREAGWVSPNRRVSLDVYPDAMTRKIAGAVVGAGTFRFDASDRMPPAVGEAFWKGTLDFVAGATLDDVLQRIEGAATDAYR